MMENATTVQTLLEVASKDVDGFPALTAAFAIGTLLHLFAFRLGEWDLATAKIIPGFVLAFVATAASIAFLQQGSELSLVLGHLAAASKTALQLLAGVIAGTYASILVYRVFFHRLNHFPGPFPARISNLWISSKIMPRMELHKDVQILHQKYGDIVRLGPTELSINNSKAIEILHAKHSTCTKGPFYGLQQPMESLLMVRNKKDHARRRKVWDRGFNAKALHDYEPRVARYTDQLLEQIDAHVGQTFNLADWFNFYSFDVMGDLSFGKSFNMLQHGVRHYFMKSLHSDMDNLGLFSHLLWLFPIFKATPILNTEHHRFWAFVRTQVHERMENKPDHPDVLSWLIDEYESLEKPTRQDLLNLYGDAYLIIVAGSDTTAVALTSMFFELACHPGIVEKLREEVDGYYRQHDKPDPLSLGKLPYLQACVDESLRLHPAVPSGLQRITPPEGVQIDDIFIPGNTIVQVPTYTAFRDERNFASPNDFIPERWTTQPELVRDMSAWVPFSTGRTSCVGKQLGLMEIRYVASQIVRKYDFSFAPGQTKEAFINGQKDAFILSLPALNVVLTRRK
ncbi:cytochrome p450 monooxygenase [Grosmannia clavigera kw1407]|uniref:Cytochrome p450 monooxygenase n=1 Tax=Grosmannia clavigera (strain kw1407 / UAMH 11150) TaxID=655863 RepID=F0XQ92_GROCL|nr:cytochrome p450 monooxygenase [Grosmannia clavigera kw1407]EFX00659.1 cytochrome p450 monooxygenase [Grosmannia clavigera kw1407]